MKKRVNIGSLPPVYGDVMRENIFAEISFADGKLAITGTIGPVNRGSAGQIIMSFREYDARGYASLDDIIPAPGWNADMIRLFFDAWQRWHLNDMRAGCEHQRKEGWDKRPIDPAKPTTAYGKHYEGQRHDSWNLLGWIRQDEHPEGLLGKPCGVCGYEYGTRWLKEEVPQSVIDFLATLPDARS
jgi:hypothetical protein